MLTATQRGVLAVGFLGAYTTFSTLMIDTIDRIEADRVVLGLANLACSIVLGIAAVYAGLWTGRWLA